MIEVGHDRHRRPRRHHLAHLRELLGDDAAHRRHQRGVLQLVFERGNRRLRGGDAALGHGHLFAPGPGLHARQCGFGSLDPLLRRIDAGSRHVAPGGGIVALLLRSRLARQQQVETLQVGGGGVEFGPGGGNVGLRGLDLRLGLLHVFAAGRRAHQAQLRFGRRLLRLRAGDGELQVGGVDGQHDRAGLDAIAFLDVQRQHPSTHLGREPHLGGLDVAGDAQRVGIGGGRAGGRGGEHGNDEETKRRGHRVRSLASMLRAVCCMWATSASRSSGAKIGI